MERDRRARVLFLSPSGGLGGAERSLLDLLDGFPRDRATPSVLLAEPGPLETGLEARGIEVLRLDFPAALARVSRRSPGPTRLAAFPALVGYLGRLVARLRQVRPSLVWSNGIKFHYLGCLAAPLAGARPVLHLRDLGPFPGLPTLARLAGARAVANSPSTATASGLPAGRIALLPTTIPALALARHAPSRAEARRRHGVPEGAFLVLGMGARVAAKGLPVLFEAFRRLAARRPAARLAWVGGEDYATEGSLGLGARLVRQAAELGLADRLHLPGAVEDVGSWLAAADVFALPSRAEGFGRAWLEAGALGLPVLASNRGGAVDLFPGGEAILLPPEDPEPWCKAMARLADDPSERLALGRAARAVARRFDTGTMAGRLDPLVAELLRGRP